MKQPIAREVSDNPENAEKDELNGNEGETVQLL